MKKLIIIITSIILVFSICSCGYFVYKCYSFNKIEKINSKIDVVEENIRNLDEEIEMKNKEIETLKENNKEKGVLLELWQKALSQVKKNS